MKKVPKFLFFYLFKPSSYLILILFLGFTSCKKDDESVASLMAPRITPMNDTTTVYARGEIVPISFKVYAPGGIAKVQVGSDTITTNGFKGDTAAVISGEYLIPANASGIHRIAIIVTDGQKVPRNNGKLTKIIVEESPCNEYLAGCGDLGKTWTLKKEAGSLLAVSSDGSEIWKSDENTHSIRTCLFNDEYTFKPGGVLVRETYGDTWADEENNAVWPEEFQTVGCHNFSEFPEKYAVWGTNEFTYTAAPNAIKIDGLGAYMGLYKAGNSAIINTPESSNVYEVVTLTATELAIKKTYEWGSWVFTFQPK